MSAHSKKLLQFEFLPLVAVGLMFAAPAFASGQTDHTAHDAKIATAKSHPAKPIAASKPVVKPTRHAAVHKPAPQTHQAAKHVEALHTPSGAPIGNAMSYGSQGNVIRKATVAHNDAAATGFDRQLLDDGSFWREDGSQTTWQQTGMASWYGGARWQGKRTSSGDRYDQNQLTAAHATLPIGTKVRVARTDGRGSVVVTINDRPGSRSRIIDLSRAAAKELGILTAGVTMVTLQPL